MSFSLCPGLVLRYKRPHLSQDMVPTTFFIFFPSQQLKTQVKYSEDRWNFVREKKNKHSGQNDGVCVAWPQKHLNSKLYFISFSICLTLHMDFSTGLSSQKTRISMVAFAAKSRLFSPTADSRKQLWLKLRAPRAKSSHGFGEERN